MTEIKELIESLRSISGYVEIIEKHRVKTDDPRVTYVLKDGTRIHEDDSVIAKLAASLTKALEHAAQFSDEAASALEALISRSEVMEEALAEMLAAFEAAETRGVPQSELQPILRRARSALSQAGKE